MLRPLLTGLLLVSGACATRQPVLLRPQVLVSPTSVWRIAVGDVIKSKVYREPELSGEALVTEGGSAFFPGLGRVPVAGLSLDSLQALIQAKYGKLVIDPAVDVGFTREVLIYGQVKLVGSQTVDPSTTVLGLLAKAGGATGGGRSPLVYLVKRDGALYTLPRDARLSAVDIVRGDAVFVQDEEFFIRNMSTMSSIYQLAQLVSVVLGASFILTR